VCQQTLASGLGVAPSLELDTLVHAVVTGHRRGVGRGAVTAS
jgi:hypothetical protein